MGLWFPVEGRPCPIPCVAYDKRAPRQGAGRVSGLLLLAALACNPIQSLRASTANPYNVTLAWNANPETDIATYELSYGTASGTHPNLVEAGSSTAVAVTGLLEGTTYYFVVTARDRAGLVSLPSAEISYFKAVTPPATLNVISQSGWALKYVDSQETNGYAATNAFDGNSATFWHTAFSTGAAPLPHEIQIDLGAVYAVGGFHYLPRQDNYLIGNIGQYEFYVSMDGSTWGSPAASGTFANDKTQKEVLFATVNARFVRLRSLTEPNGAQETSCAELNVLGTLVTPPFAVWAAALPQNAQGFSQDADHDGVSNGMEYAFGRDATSSSGINGVAQLPVVTVAGSGSLHHLTLTLSLPEPAPADIVYDIQAANGLTGSWTAIMEKSGTGPWTALGNSGATVVLSPNGSGRTSCAITDAQGYHFMRLAVTSSSAAAPVTSIPSTASALYATNSTATIPVTSNTNWTASSDQAWAVVSPTSGSGNGTVTVTCLANPAATSRTAVVTIGAQTCVLTQAAWPYAIWAAGLTQGAQGFAMDADHDGVSNGMEYALGGNAASSSGANGMAQLPVITTVGSGTSRNLSMTLNLPDPAPVDIVYDVQVANGLTGQWTDIMEKSGTGQWSTLGNSGATLSSSPAGSGRTTYTITDVHGYHFMRLAVKSL